MQNASQNRIFFIIIGFVISFFYSNVNGEKWLIESRKSSSKLTKHIYEQEQKIFKRDPLAEQYISQPSRRHILEDKFLKRLKKMTPEAALQIPETLSVLAIRVNFLEDTTSLTTGNGKIVLKPDTSYGPEYDKNGERNLYYEPAHDSIYFHYQLEALRNYYWDDSNHKLWIKWKIVPDDLDSSYTVPHKMTYYGDPYNFVSGLFNLLKDAIAVADTDTKANIDFSNYDSYILFHAGSMWQTDWGDSPYDLAAVYIGGADYFFGEPIFANNRTDTITDGVIYCETAKQDGYAAFIQGGLAHEFGHQIGLPDLYDTSGKTMGVGGWALMGTGNWNLDGLVPPHHSAWNTIFDYLIHPHTAPNDKLQFNKPVVIDHDTTGVEVSYLGSSDTTANKVIKIPINAKQYFLVTNRYTYMNPDTFHYGPNSSDIDSNGFRIWKKGVLVKIDDYDISLPPEPNSGGLAIWHIDCDKVSKGFNDSTNAINAGFPKGIDMEEADGIQDFEKSLWEVYNIDAAFYGTPYDLFFDGGINNEFTPYTTPNTNDNQDCASHLKIFNISSPGPVMTFDVKYEWGEKNFPVFLKDGFDVNSPIAYDVNNDGKKEIIIGTVGYADSVDTIGGRLLIFNSDGSSYTSDPEGVAAEFINGGYWYYTYSTVGIGDVNGDGHTDIVSASTDGRVYVWQADSLIGNRIALIGTYTTNGAIITTPLIADIDGDGIDDIIIGSDDMYVYALHLHNGSISPIPGFPVILGHWIWSTPIFVNNYLYVLTNDGLLYKISTGGKILWKKLQESLSFTASSPVAGDMDRDGKYEIIVSTGTGEVSSINEDGTLKWQRKLKDTTFYSTPAISDLDGDGFLDVVLAAGSSIYAFNKNGALLNGFPIRTGDSLTLQSSISIGDLDNDGSPDILIGSLNNRIYGYNYKGEKLAGFPLSCGGKTYSTPGIINLDDDENVEIIASADYSGIYIWELPSTYNSKNITWPYLRRSIKHNAVYPDSLLPPLQKETSNKLITKSSFYIYPNPIVGSKATVRYTLGDKVDRVTLRIFNIAGNELKEINGKKDIGDNDNEVDLWDIAPGVYVCQIVVEKNGEKVQFYKKFAIVK